MKTIAGIIEMQAVSDKLRLDGRKIGFVPTMGALHEGHLSLVDHARELSDVVVMSIFVNPTQFGRGEDFEQYPRDLQKDRRLAESRGVDYIFAPSETEMYPEEPLTYVEVQKVSQLLEGEFRLGHFKGVTTVVAKLLNIVKPRVVVFGQKDAQQAFIIKEMVKDLNFDLEIVIAPIVREKDGLAMSSRNVYLSPDQRKRATVLYRSLKLAESMITGGETNLVKVRAAMLKLINNEPDGKIDYVSFVDPANFEKVENAEMLTQVLSLIAVRFGQTRLIDNMLVKVVKNLE
ncbi:MAG TPA: pantoate--beta-alanine ligase [Candidatus Acidoferrales bacterium]|nr:pantoate--beta-alanine ligase [Candidatus Acidoferrales bacterium]